MKKDYPADQSNIDKTATELKTIPNMFDPKLANIGTSTKVKKKKIALRSSGKDNQVYGFKTFYDKVVEKQLDNTDANKNPFSKLNLMQSLLEDQDFSYLPSAKVSQIKKAMRKGVSGEANAVCRWKSAGDLVKQAYKFCEIEWPRLNSKGWQQILDVFVPYAVKILSAQYGTEGPQAKWRTQEPVIYESINEYQLSGYINNQYVSHRVRAVDDTIALEFVNDLLAESQPDYDITVTSSEDGQISLRLSSFNVVTSKNLILTRK